MQEYGCVRKIEEEYEGNFCSVKEAVKRVLEKFPSGKVLFVSDSSCLGTFCSEARMPRSLVTVLAGESALPLFCMPDDVRAVVAAGRKETLLASRVYASVNGLYSLVLPTDASCFGAAEGAAEALSDGVKGRVTLSESEVCCDLALMKPTFGRALAGLYLSRLSLFEIRALCLLRREEMPARYEEAFSLLNRTVSTERDVVFCNLALRNMEAEGLYEGEGRALAARLGARGDELSEWHAYLQLTSLYKAVFLKGKPRRYFTPDYAARFRKAGLGEEGYRTAQIPTAAQYAFRAVALERARGELSREINAISLKKHVFLENLMQFTPADLRFAYDEELKILPEIEPRGLTALVRDFGLMEAI